MNKMDITRMISKAGLQLKKHSPEILAGVGVVGIVTSTVMACKATLKVHEVLEERKDMRNAVMEALEDPTISEEKYSVEDAKKDLVSINVQTGIKFVKLYGPAVVLGALSISSMLASNHILSKRNLALAAAYKIIDTDFKEYRERVTNRYGAETDRELLYGVEKVETTTVDENGKKETATEYVKTANPASEFTKYDRCFTTGCKGYTKDANYNRDFVRQAEIFAQRKLDAQGYLFLNDVYEMFGFQKTPAGQIVGWVKDGDTSHGIVNFGVYNLKDEMATMFVNGDELSVWLKFNVDGVVYDLI